MKSSRSRTALVLAIGLLLSLAGCGESIADDAPPPSVTLTTVGATSADGTTFAPGTTVSAEAWPQSPVGVLASDDGVFLLLGDGAVPGPRLWDRPSGAAFLVGADLVVVQEATDLSINPPGVIMTFDRAGARPLVAGDGELSLLGAGFVDERPVAFVSSTTGGSPEDMDERLLLVDHVSDQFTDLGSVGGWESGVGRVHLAGETIAFLTSSEDDISIRALSLNGIELWNHPLGSDSHFSLAARADTLTVLQPRFIEPDFAPALTLTEFNLMDGSSLGQTDLELDLGEEVKIEGGFCFTAEWWGESILCDQTYGGPILIDSSGSVRYFGHFEQGVVTAARGPAVTDEVCLELVGDERSNVAGPFFVCETESGFGGQVFSRDGVDSAEEALRAWLQGPKPEEQAVGY